MYESGKDVNVKRTQRQNEKIEKHMQRGATYGANVAMDTNVLFPYGLMKMEEENKFESRRFVLSSIAMKTPHNNQITRM